MSFAPYPRRRQAGFALLELSVALLIGTLLLVWGSAAIMRRADDAAARAAGAWLLEIRHAASRMMERHFDRLAEGAPPTDESGKPLYADPLAPTLAELKAQGLLPGGYPETSPMGGGARVRLAVSAACPGESCRVDALVYAARPLQATQGVPDLMRLPLLAEAAGGYGGYATAGAGGRLRGAAFDFPNPYAPGDAALPAGTPVLWAGMDLATAIRYVRRGDERDPQLQGPLSAAGRIHGGEYLELAGRANLGAACAPNGLIGRTAAGQLLSCQSGTWKPANSLTMTLSTLSCAARGATEIGKITDLDSCMTGWSLAICSDGGVGTLTRLPGDSACIGGGS
jgi:prepilin-type N-terminal cleavage/methylation domain-containing protein